MLHVITKVTLVNHLIGKRILALPALIIPLPIPNIPTSIKILCRPLSISQSVFKVAFVPPNVIFSFSIPRYVPVEKLPCVFHPVWPAVFPADGLSRIPFSSYYGSSGQPKLPVAMLEAVKYFSAKNSVAVLDFCLLSMR